MVTPNIYREASERIVNDTERFCCDALRINGYNFVERWDALDAFDKMFCPENVGLLSYWWGFEKTKESQLARSLALLFMAEMTQDEIENNSNKD